MPNMSLFTEAIALIPSVKDTEGRFITDNWLQLCRLVLPVIGETLISLMMAYFYLCLSPCSASIKNRTRLCISCSFRRPVRDGVHDCEE
jgi:hypothetical protein